MRVLLATDSPEPSGVGEHMLTLAAALAEKGLQVKLAFPAHSAGEALTKRAHAIGLSAQRLMAAEWPKFLSSAQADIVHIHAGIGWEGLDLCQAAAESGATLVRTEHLPWLLTDPDQICAYFDAIGCVDQIISVSREAARGWREALAKLGSRLPPVAAIANGITPPISALESQTNQATTPISQPNPARGRPDLAETGQVAAPVSAAVIPPLILCVGRFTPQKRHRSLLAALARLRAQGVMARLWLVGSGPLRPMLERMSARLGLGETVHFLGQRSDVPDLMAKADLLALPSIFEGLPLVVLEAMAAGLPVVATRIGGSTEALGAAHPWLARPGSSRDLAKALGSALSDPAARHSVAKAQKARFALQFTAHRMADETIALYRAAAQKRRSPAGRTQPMRLGFIGAGGIAHRHFGVLETMEDVEILAVADPDPARAAEAAQRLGARAYADHQTMLQEQHLDAVFICIPPFAHGPAELDCLARGLPFFVEKPLSLDLDLAEKIAAQVDSLGLVTAVGYHWRYLDTMDQARAHLASNPAHLMQGFWIDQTPPPQWWWRADGSGGQVVEQATHIIDAARFLAGDVIEVYGIEARRDREDFDGLTVPTASAATLRFASGAIANLAATCLLRWNHRVGLHVFSDALALEITDHDLMVDVGQGRPVRAADGDPVWRQDRDFIEAVMGRDNRIRCPYPEALETHRVALAMSQSARSGTPVRLEGLRADPQPMFC